MTKSTWLLAAAIGVTLCGLLYGQYYEDDYHASTAGEGYARGMAEIVRAAGEANLRNAQAVETLQDARGKAANARLQEVNAYYAARRMNAEYRAEQEGPALSQSDYVRLAAAAAPDRLGTDQLDAQGNINWPELLTDEAYAEQTSQLDALFAQRAANKGKADAYVAQQIQITCKTLENMLSQKIRETPSLGQQLVQAKNFVRSLAYAARG